MLHFLLCDIQHHIKEEKQHAFNILDRDHPKFKHLFNTYFCELCSALVGAEIHAAEILTIEEERRSGKLVFFQ